MKLHKIARLFAVFGAAALIAVPAAVIARDGSGEQKADISEYEDRSSTSETPEMPEASRLIMPRTTSFNDNEGEDMGHMASASGIPRSTQFRINVPKNLEDDANKIGNEDEHVTGISIASGSKEVDMEVEQPAKLFGLFPVKYHMSIKVNPVGKKIEFTRPWWLFLATDNADQIASAVSNQEKSLTSSTNLGQVISKLGQLIKSLTQ